MLIRKLRLKKGWSQDHLAHLSGLNIKTVQRIERGNKASLESLNSLAAVFEVALEDLQGNQETKGDENAHDEEFNAIERVQDIKGFYTHLAIFVAVHIVFFFLNLVNSPDEFWFYLPAFGWGIGILIHGLCVFEVFNLLGPEWEKKQIEKRLKRKL
jgi:transcriptional regulator with XRE-family HTH domain